MWVLKALVCLIKGHVFRDITWKDSHICYHYRLCLHCGKIENQQDEALLIAESQKSNLEALPHQAEHSHLSFTRRAKTEIGRSFQNWSV